MPQSLTRALALPTAALLKALPSIMDELEASDDVEACEEVQRALDFVVVGMGGVDSYVEKREDPCRALAELRIEDPERWTQLMRAAAEISRPDRDEFVSVLSPEELQAVAKFSAGRSEPSSSRAPAVKQSRSQMREPNGRFRASMFRRVANAQPRLGGTFFR